MATFLERYHEMKRFLGFTDADAARLVALAPLFAEVGAGVTDRFYEVLAQYPETARMIEGRVDLLKRTHAQWMTGLFAGDYGDDYANGRLRIGATHVRVGLDPAYVDGVMSMLRQEGVMAISAARAASGDAPEHICSTIRVLDLDLFIINYAYSEERLDRLSRFTGMKRALIENLIRKAS